MKKPPKKKRTPPRRKVIKGTRPRYAGAPSPSWTPPSLPRMSTWPREEAEAELASLREDASSDDPDDAAWAKNRLAEWQQELLEDGDPLGLVAAGLTRVPEEGIEAPNPTPGPETA